jgi:Bacterial Ig-like domain/Glucose / Sorbosone dehydrogenase
MAKTSMRRWGWVAALAGLLACSGTSGGGDGGDDGGNLLADGGTDGGTGPGDGGSDGGGCLGLGCPLDGGVDGGWDGGVHPSVRGVDPIDGKTSVFRDTSVNVDVLLPNLGQGVDPRTLGPGTVELFRASDGAQVPATVNTSGGGDAIVLQPTMLLDANTEYHFVLTQGVADISGDPFIPFESHFTTDQNTKLRVDPRYRYDVRPTALYQGTPISSLLFGPDGMLYSTALDGIVRRWTIAPDGTLANEEDWSGLQGRTLIGLAFENPSVLWVTTNAPVYVQPAPDWTGTITRITIDRSQTGFVATSEDLVVGLPRSVADHMTNSLAFGPDGALYVTQGSTTAAGAPDKVWGNRSEHLLTSAVLRVDTTLLVGQVNVVTEQPDGTPGPYDPFAPGAPVTLYATGLRNSYDLIWHSNGHLYCPTNGTAAGGNTPASPVGVNPGVPALIGVPTQDDFLFEIDPASPGGYYGHPNPTRGTYVLNGGNPTIDVDPAEVAPTPDGGVGYPVGTFPDANWRGSVLNFGRNRSPDGVIETKSGVFGGAMQGRLYVVEYSAGDDILALPIPPGGGPIDRNAVLQVASGLSDPVDLAEDVTTGNLYVAELVQGGLGGGSIVLLTPTAGGTP